MSIIWRGFITYLDNNLRAGKSVNIKKFGAFTYDINTELPKIATRSTDVRADLHSQRLDRKHIHHLR